MDKFTNYVRILLEALGWKEEAEKKGKTEDFPLDFLNDLDNTAKKYGYEAIGWGEAEELGKRVIMFCKIKP